METENNSFTHFYDGLNIKLSNSNLDSTKPVIPKSKPKDKKFNIFDFIKNLTKNEK
jgi:hypothetical protein